MAVEVENSGQLEEFLAIVRRRALWVLYPLALFVTVGVCFAVIVPKKYVCDTRILVRNTLPGILESDTVEEARMAAHQIRSQPRMRAVLISLGWSDYMNLPQGEKFKYEERVRKAVRVEVPNTPSTDQQIVAVSYSNTNPSRAKSFLEELTGRWKTEVLEQGRNAQRKAWEDLKTAKNQLQGQRDETQKKILELRKAHSIPVDTGGNLTRSGLPTDPRFTQISDLDTEADALDLDILELEGQIGADQDRLAAEPLTISEVEVEGEVENESKITKLSEKIFELQQELRDEGYKSDHPKYKRLNDDIRAFQEEIRFLETTEVAGVETDSRTPNPRRAELEAAIADAERTLTTSKSRRDVLRARVQDLKDQASELQDVYSMIQSLEAKRELIDNDLVQVGENLAEASRAYQRVEGPAGNPFEVLAEIEMPQQPSEPNPVFIVAFALFLGAGLGLGMAALTEFGKSVFRSVGDVGRVMVVPVLGTINAIQTRREVRRRKAGQFFVGTLTFGLISIVSYVTWAWKMNPQLLSSTVYEAIESFRAGFE